MGVHTYQLVNFNLCIFGFPLQIREGWGLSVAKHLFGSRSQTLRAVWDHPSWNLLETGFRVSFIRWEFQYGLGVLHAASRVCNFWHYHLVSGGVNVKQDKNDYRRKLPFDKPWTLYIFVRVFRGGSWVEEFKIRGRKLCGVVRTTNHIEIKPERGGGGEGGDEDAYNRNKETSYSRVKIVLHLLVFIKLLIRCTLLFTVRWAHKWMGWGWGSGLMGKEFISGSLR